VVANSLAEANKAANDSYNYRVTECRFATWILAKKRGLKIDGIWKPLDLQLELKATLDELLVLVDKELHEEPYTVPELMKVFNVDEEFLREKSTIKATFNAASTFKLRQRIQHVYSEAGRVELFRAVCKDELEYSGVLRKLGKLMNMSHQSLRELYECSHPQLDTLVHLAQDASHGARLTGAGWGGCAVALVESAQLDHFLYALRTKYYQPILGIDNIEEHVFVTQPSQGASILEED
jgi:N-acetylgalactosamine kinase